MMDDKALEAKARAWWNDRDSYAGNYDQDPYTENRPLVDLLREVAEEARREAQAKLAEAQDQIVTLDAERHTALEAAIAEHEQFLAENRDALEQEARAKAAEAEVARLREERDREWSYSLWPENPEGAEPFEPKEAKGHIKAVVARERQGWRSRMGLTPSTDEAVRVAVEEECKALRGALRDLLRDVDAVDEALDESAGKLRVDAEYARRVLLRGEGEKP